LPDIDGLVLLDRLRALAPTVPVIIVSVIDDTRTVVDALEAGAVDYVTKPFEEKDLLLRVRARVSEARLRLPRVVVIEPDVGLRAAITVALERECLVTAVASAMLAAPELRACTPDIVVIGRGAHAAADGALQAFRLRWPGVPILSAAGDFHALLVGIAYHLPPSLDLPSVGAIGRRTALLMERIAASYESISVEDLARSVPTSARNLSRIFREEVGMAPRDFIVRVRVHAALCLIRETQDKLDAIASRVGLHDAVHLYRRFRQQGLNSPGTYRP